MSLQGVVSFRISVPTSDSTTQDWVTGVHPSRESGRKKREKEDGLDLYGYLYYTWETGTSKDSVYNLKVEVS